MVELCRQALGGEMPRGYAPPDRGTTSLTRPVFLRRFPKGLRRNLRPVGRRLCSRGEACPAIQWPCTCHPLAVHRDVPLDTPASTSRALRLLENPTLFR